MNELQELRIKYVTGNEIIDRLQEKDSNLAKPKRKTAINDIRIMMEEYNNQAMAERLRLETKPKNKTWLS